MNNNINKFAAVQDNELKNIISTTSKSNRAMTDTKNDNENSESRENETLVFRKPQIVAPQDRTLSARTAEFIGILADTYALDDRISAAFPTLRCCDTLAPSVLDDIAEHIAAIRLHIEAAVGECISEHIGSPCDKEL